MEIPETIRSRSFEAYRNTIRDIIAQMPVSTADHLSSKIQELRGNFYLTYPFLFSSHYPLIPEEQVYQLTLTGNLYFTYLLLLDEFLDHDTNSHFLVALHAFHEKALRQLCFLFPSDSSFWPIFEQYERTFFSAVSKEFDFVFPKRQEGFPVRQDLLATAQAKSVFAKAATAALWVLMGCVTPQDPFIETQDSFHTALQLLDDLEDWKDDYRKQKPSYLLSLVLADKELQDVLKHAGSEEIEILGRYIHYSGASENILNDAIAFFEHALETSKMYDIPYWKSVVEQYRQKSLRLRQNLREAKGLVLARHQKVKEIHSGSLLVLESRNVQFGSMPIGSALASGLAYVLVEQQNDYPEMERSVLLPLFDRAAEQTPELMVKKNLYHRALVLETLLDVSEAFPDIMISEVLLREARELVTSRIESVQGGWSLFPEYHWLPPHTGILAEVVLCLSRLDYPSKEHLLDGAIRLLLTSNRYPNGTFRTWILDPRDESSLQSILQQLVATHWNEYFGMDVENTANMLYALSCYDTNKYDSTLIEGTQAVADAQVSSGEWPSPWCSNKFFSMYLCVRLLTTVRIRDETLQKCCEYLLQSQRDDGGWGHHESDSLSTALALLTLMLLGDAGCGVSEQAVERGVAFVLVQQQPDGGWNRAFFMRLALANRHIVYKNRTITTAFALRALSTLARRSQMGVSSKSKTDHA